MDDVETGYYLSLDSYPEMFRNQSTDSNFNNSKSNKHNHNVSNRGVRETENDKDENDSESVNSEEFLDSVNDIYGLDRGKTKLYKEFFKLYTERQESETFTEVDSFEKNKVKNKIILWLLIIILVSNPVLGGYNLYHFSNYKNYFLSHFSNLNIFVTNYKGYDPTKNPDLSFKNNSNFNNSKSNKHNHNDGVDLDDATVKEKKWYEFKLLNSFSLFQKNDSLGDNRADSSTKDKKKTDSKESKGDSKDTKEGKETKEKKEPKKGNKEDDLQEEMVRVSEFVGKKIGRYCFFEIFGELIFGLFSLLVVTICKLPCNNSNSVRFMLPSLFMFYMIIYRFLASYVLLTSLKIFFYSLMTFNPSWVSKMPSFLVYLLSFKKLDLNDLKTVFTLRNLYELDELNFKLLWVFCLENVYITFTEAVELFSFFSKVIFSIFRKKVLRKKDLHFYSSNEYNNFKLLKSCFTRDTFSSTDPHEKYIHSLYNYASDIGTYLKNIEIGDYTQGLDNLANKFKNRKSNSSNY